MITDIYNLILYQPLFNLLVFFRNIIPSHDVGLAIIALTVFTKIILYPFSKQAIKSQKALQGLQPKIDELKRKYKDQKEQLAQEMLALYKRERINPLSSCLPLLVQLPFFIAIFQVFRNGLDPANLTLLYPFVKNPGLLDPMFLGVMDLSRPFLGLALVTGLAQFWQTRMLISKKNQLDHNDETGSMATIMNKQMSYFMPIITVVIGATLPSGLLLYWLVTTLLTIIQQYYMFSDEKKPHRI